MKILVPVKIETGKLCESRGALEVYIAEDRNNIMNPGKIFNVDTR